MLKIGGEEQDIKDANAVLKMQIELTRLGRKLQKELDDTRNIALAVEPSPTHKQNEQEQVFDVFDGEATSKFSKIEEQEKFDKLVGNDHYEEQKFISAITRFADYDFSTQICETAQSIKHGKDPIENEKQQQQIRSLQDVNEVCDFLLTGRCFKGQKELPYDVELRKKIILPFFENHEVDRGLKVVSNHTDNALEGKNSFEPIAKRMEYIISEAKVTAGSIANMSVTFERLSEYIGRCFKKEASVNGKKFLNAIDILSGMDFPRLAITSEELSDKEYKRNVFAAIHMFQSAEMKEQLTSVWQVHNDTKQKINDILTYIIHLEDDFNKSEETGKPCIERLGAVLVANEIMKAREQHQHSSSNVSMGGCGPSIAASLIMLGGLFGGIGFAKTHHQPPELKTKPAITQPIERKPPSKWTEVSKLPKAPDFGMDR